jgi:putative alpha-1,2-mannosidase
LIHSGILDGFLIAACHSVKVGYIRLLADRAVLNDAGYTQGGSNADVVLADAYVKGLSEGIDWDDGYAAVWKDAEEEPFAWSNEGRGGLASWKSLNYIPVEDFSPVGFGTMTRSISRTLEYSYNDFTISQMARGLNRTTDAEHFESTSRYWQNLFRADQGSSINGTDTGFVGFFQPKHLNRTWGYQVSRPIGGSVSILIIAGPDNVL